MHDLIVIGGGPAGLAAGVAAQRAGRDVLVLEASGRAGGNVHSEQVDGHVVDWGPTTMRLADPAVLPVLEAFGVTHALVDAAPDVKSRRMLVRGGQLTPVPGLPWSLLPGGLYGLGWVGRLVRGAVFPPRRDDTQSLDAWVRAQLGERVLRHAVDPFVSGVYAGDPEQLIAALAFPELMKVAEAGGGSLLRGALRRVFAPRAAPPRLVNFAGGMSGMTDGAAARLGGALRLGCEVLELVRDGEVWRVMTTTGELRSNRVVLAAPCHALGSVLQRLDSDLADRARAVPYAPIALVATRIPTRDLPGAPRAFGFLVPRAESSHVLGALFTSLLFPGRAPDDERAITLFVGGRRHETWLAGATDEDIRSDARALLQRTLRWTGDATLHVRRIPRAIAQYEAPVLGLGEAVERLHTRHPTLRWASNAPGGVALPSALVRGWNAGAS